MGDDDTHGLCEAGQRALIETRYIDARRLFVMAEAKAWEERDFDALSRLYLPLQEARRQIRQRCGEGVVDLTIVAVGPGVVLDPMEIVERHSQGQILVAGFGDIRPAVQTRAAIGDRFLEVFLASVDPATGDVTLYPRSGAPAGLTLKRADLPARVAQGTVETYALTMAWWEQLAAPFLAKADSDTDPFEKMRKYRDAIEVDAACELAHQGLAEVARQLARTGSVSK